MHKTFYASGFLYHLPSQQILLQKINSNNLATFDLFSGRNQANESSMDVFARVLMQIIGLEIKPKLIKPVYDYYSHELSADHFILYVDIKSKPIFSQESVSSRCEWINIKQLTKIKIPAQSRHDIIIGQRVIRAEVDQIQKNTNPHHKS